MEGNGVVIVGEAGGVTEGEQGRPFVGRTGRELRAALSQIDVPIDAIHNMVPRALQSHTPSKREVAVCWSCHVGEWLVSLQPKLIVAVGGVAAGWLANVGVEKFHGSAYPCVQPGLEGVPVFVTFHPSAMVRNRPKYQVLFEGDYTALEAYYHESQHFDRSNYTLDDISSLRRTIEPAARIVVDFESTSLDTENAVIVGVAVRTTERTHYFHGSPNVEDFEALARANTVWYNANYDIKLFPTEYRYLEVDDTFLKAKILQKPYGSLRNLLAYEFGIDHASMKTLKESLDVDNDDDPTSVLTGVGYIPLAELAAKACEDVEGTDKLDALYDTELASSGMEHIYLLERAVAPEVRRTEDAGMVIDVQAATNLLIDTEMKVEAAKAKFRSQAPMRHLSRVVTTTWGSLFRMSVSKHKKSCIQSENGLWLCGCIGGWPGHGRPKVRHDWVEPINPNSNQQLAEMFTALGIVLTKTTKSGDPSVDGEVLESITHPLADAVRQFKRLDKKRQFVLGLSEMGGVFHPRLKQLGAVSGRMSSGGDEEAEQ